MDPAQPPRRPVDPTPLASTAVQVIEQLAKAFGLEECRPLGVLRSASRWAARSATRSGQATCSGGSSELQAGLECGWMVVACDTYRRAKRDWVVTTTRRADHGAWFIAPRALVVIVHSTALECWLHRLHDVSGHARKRLGEHDVGMCTMLGYARCWDECTRPLAQAYLPHLPHASPPSHAHVTRLHPSHACPATSWSCPWHDRTCHRKRRHSSGGISPRNMTKPFFSKAARSDGRNATHGATATSSPSLPYRPLPGLAAVWSGAMALGGSEERTGHESTCSGVAGGPEVD